MDLRSFVANPRPLNLMIISSTKPLIRTELLFCCGVHRFLRPPGLLFHWRRNRCVKFGALTERKFSVKASNLGSAVVAAAAAVVTAVSALTVVLFATHIRKNVEKFDFNQLSAFSWLIGDIIKNFIRNQFLNVRSLIGENNVAQTEVLVKNVCDSTVETEERMVQLQETKRGPNLVHDTSLSLETVGASHSCLLASDSYNAGVANEYEESYLSNGPALLHEDAAASLQLVLATGMSEITSEKGRQESEFESEIPKVTAKTKPVAVSVDVDHEPAGKGGRLSYLDIAKESMREGLHTFFAANQSTESPLSLSCADAVPSSASSLKRYIPPLKVKTKSKGIDPSPEQSLKGFVEHEAPVGHNGGGLSPKNRNVRGSKRFLRDKEGGTLPKDNKTQLPHLPQPNGIQSNEKDHFAKKYRAYHQYLKDGRLAECIDFLEDMDRKGLLDMDKVYHTKFFKTCKVQKAVTDALRFCKLIQNPTLSTFNMLMSVCANSHDSGGGFQVLQLTREAGLKADCKLYTTLITTCAKSGKVDVMFEVFHEMVNTGVEPNVHTYGALIDGCARVGQVAKAFGAYGIMRSKNVKPDRVVFNALITACGQSGAVDRAFDVLAEMRAEAQPIDPDHVTVGALMKACANAGQVDRAQEVYKMIHDFKIKGTPEVYTIAVNCCSQTGDWDFAQNVQTDMRRNGVVPDEMFLSALIDVAGHAGKIDTAFEILQEARKQGMKLGIIPYSSLMGACSNVKNWQKALELYADIKSIKLKPTVSTINALITALCEGDQLQKAIEILSDMKNFGLSPNTVTYSILLVACERKDNLEAGFMLLSQAKEDSVVPTLIMNKCIIGMCLRRFEKASSLGEPVFSFNSGRPQINNEWTSLALKVYRERVSAGEKPTMEVFSQVLGCLQIPNDELVKNRLLESLGVTVDKSESSKLCPLIDGFGEYDPRAFSLLEEAASLGIVPCVSFKDSPIVVDAKKLQVHIAEVYMLTIFKGLKHRLAAGAKLPNVTILLPVEKMLVTTSDRSKTISLAGRISQAIASLLRRLVIPYHGNESYGKIRINGISLRRWLQPKLSSPFSGKPGELGPSQSRIGKEIFNQQRNIRTSNYSLE